jgi:hypothetical protein
VIVARDPETDQATLAKIQEMGGNVIAGSAEEFAGWMKENIASWGAVVREANIKVE